jgi:hypothetical protein
MGAFSPRAKGVIRERLDTPLMNLDSQRSGRAQAAPGHPEGLPPHPVDLSPVNTLPLARLTAGGTDGNERLTALTGVVLLVLLAVLGVTILRIGSLLSVHMFLGMLLIGPVALKLASTGYRFVRYYTSEPHYLRKGPPPILLRLMAPILVLSTVVVFASGVALMLIGPVSRQPLLLIHKVSFIVWVAVTALHVLGHIADLRRALTPSRPQLSGLEDGRGGRIGRALALSGVLVAGVVLAIISIPQFAPWTNHQFPHH